MNRCTSTDCTSPAAFWLIWQNVPRRRTCAYCANMAKRIGRALGYLVHIEIIIEFECASAFDFVPEEQ